MDKNEVKKDLYKSKNLAKFSHYQSGKLFYNVELADGVYQFPISTVQTVNKYIETELSVEDRDIVQKYILHDEDEWAYGPAIQVLELSDDLGETSFDAEIKGSELIRWISKAIDNETIIKLAPKPVREREYLGPR